LYGPDAVSPRELFNLVSNLPVDSATARSSTGPDAWTIEEHLLAGVIDEQRFTNKLLYKVHNLKPAAGSSAPTFAPLRRPGAAELAADTTAALASPAEMRSFFGAARFVP
jgi:hypothetical protein